MLRDAPISVSVVVPVYSGEVYLPVLVEHLEMVRADWRVRSAPMDLSEVIFVDDAAVDGSPAVLDRLAKEHNWITVIHMMRNFGQHAATIAGILHSSGDWVVTMDEDLQHPPAEIENLLKQAVLGGADIVYGRSVGAVHEVRSRDWTSKGFKRLMVFLTGNTSIAYFTSFRLLRGSLARAASSVCAYETYFDVALSWFTESVQFCSLELKDQRFIKGGRSGYSFGRLLTHARRLLISSQVKSVRLFGLFGLVVVAASAIGGVSLLVEKIFSPESISIQGWTSLMLLLLLFGGIITCMVSLALEYLSTLILAANGKPIFFAVDRSIDGPLFKYFSSDAT
jgi:polyisoprenyl-phosphate glycosyltransferase